MTQTLVKKLQMEYFSLIILCISCIIFRFTVGNVGMGYLLTSFLIYELVWLVFGQRYSTVIGRKIRSKYNKGKALSARRIWKTSFIMQLVTAFISFIILSILGSFILKNYFDFNHSYFLIYFFGVIILLRMISEGYACYLVGKNYELASGIAAIFRQIIILVMGLILSAAVKDYGMKVAALLKQEDFESVYGNIGILISAVVAEIVVLIFLMIVRLSVKKRTSEYDDEYYQRSDGHDNIFVLAWSHRFTEGLNYFLLFIPALIIIFFVVEKFDNSILFSENIGFLFGAVFAPCMIVLFFSFAITMPLVAKTIQYRKRGEMRYSRLVFSTGIHLNLIYSFFGGAFFIAEGNILSSIFSKNVESSYGSYYIYGSFIVMLASISIFMIRILILTRQAIWVLATQVVSSVVFVILLNVLSKTQTNILMAILIAILVYFGLQAVSYTALCIIRLDMSLEPVGCVFIPLLSMFICAGVNILLTRLMTSYLGNLFTLIITSIEMIFLYTVLLLLFRNFGEKELEYIPGNKFISAMGQMMHLL